MAAAAPAAANGAAGRPPTKLGRSHSSLVSVSCTQRYSVFDDVALVGTPFAASSAHMEVEPERVGGVGAASPSSASSRGPLTPASRSGTGAGFPCSPSAAAQPQLPLRPGLSGVRAEPDAPGTTAALFAEYELGESVGRGHFAVVYRATEARTRAVTAAVKSVEKAKLSTKDRSALRSEVAILSSLLHPGIIAFRAWAEDARFFWIVTELLTGGELFHRIEKKQVYDENDARKVVRTIADALRYLHHYGVAHRDIKPENILMSRPGDDTAIKLADFGFARIVPKAGQGTACGTPAYVAPEVISGQFYDGRLADAWSLGVVTYILLSGYPPFYANTQQELFQLKIRKAAYKFDSPWWDPVSPEAKDFVRRCFVVDSERRMRVRDMLDHEWLAGPSHSSSDLTASVANLRLFNAKRKLRGFFTTAILTNQLGDMLKRAAATAAIRRGG